MKEEYIITDNACEKVSVAWDEERFAIIHQLKMPDDATKKVIILNLKEASELAVFIRTVMSKEGHSERD